MCDALCRTHRVIPDGTAVTGRYYGHTFTGVVLSHVVVGAYVFFVLGVNVG